MLVRYGSKLKILKTASWDEIFLKDKPLKKQASFIKDKALDRILEIKPIALNPDKYLYIQARAVSGGEKHGPNDNGDYFRWQELIERYMTFIGAAVNVDHQNNDPRWAVGLIIDAILNENEWVEIVLAIDKAKAEKVYPGIINGIETGLITDVSMGCLVEFSICSTCLRTKANGDESQLVVGDGLAYEPDEYCEHVNEESPAFCKGGLDSDNEICYEDNRGVTFFEESIITTQGADPQAKISKRLASLNIDRKSRIASSNSVPKDTSSLVPYIDFRLLKSVRMAHLKKLSSGEVTMGDKAVKKAEDEKKPEEKKEEVKVGEKKEVVAAAAPTDTQKDAGDYGSPTEKDKALFDESKKKSPTEDEQRGSQVATQQDRGDYVLASLNAVKVLREASKKDPSLVASLIPLIATEEMIDEKKEEAEDVELEKPKEKSEEKAATEVPESKEVGQKPVAVEKGEDVYSEAKSQGTEATAGKSKKDQKLSGIDSKFAAVKGKAGELLSQLAALLGNPTETMKDAGDYGSGAQKDNETKSVQDSNASKSEAEKKAQDSAGNATKEERMKQVDLTKKVAAKKIAENEDKKIDYVVGEMAKGKTFDDSMAEAEERYPAEVEAGKTAAADQDINDGTDKTKESPATVDKAEGENKMQDTELNQESAGSVIEPDKKDREIAASKKEANGDMVAEKMKDEEKKEEAATDDGVTEDEKKKLEDIKLGEADTQIVGKIDVTAESMEDEENKLKEEAKTLAELGLPAEAKVVAKRIASLKSRVAILNSLANSIEDNASRIAKISNVAQKKKATASFSLLVKKASDVLAEVEKDETEEKKEVESSIRQASQTRKVAAENAQLKTAQLKQKAAMTRFARSQAVSSLIKVARNKGLLDESQVTSTIARWAKLSDEAFTEVKAHFESAKAVKIAGGDQLRRNLREATAGLSRVADDALEGVEAPITATMKGDDLDAQLSGMFMDSPYPAGNNGRPTNSF